MRRWAMLAAALFASGAFVVAGCGGTTVCTRLCGNPDRINGVSPCAAITAKSIVDVTTTLAVKTTAAIQGTESFDARDAVHRHCEYRLEATEGPRKGSRTVALDSWIDTPSGTTGNKYQALKRAYPPGSPVVPNVEVYQRIGDEAFVVGEADVFVVTASGVVIKIQPSPITPITGIPVIRRDALTTLGEQAADYIQH